MVFLAGTDDPVPAPAPPAPGCTCPGNSRPAWWPGNFPAPASPLGWAALGAGAAALACWVLK